MQLRCIRCGTPVQGVAQYCPDCAATMQPKSSVATAEQGQATNCPTCGARSPAEAAFCMSCGQPIRGRYAPSSRPAADPYGGHSSSIADPVGPGRYILNFLIAGLIGVLITYLFRNQGSLSTWICIPITVLGIIVLASLS